MMWRDSQVSCQIHQSWNFHLNQYLALNGRDPRLRIPPSIPVSVIFSLQYQPMARVPVASIANLSTSR